MKYIRLIILVPSILFAGCYLGTGRESCKNIKPRPNAPPGHKCDQFLL